MIFRDRYWVLSKLGEGGMGITYRVWEPQADQGRTLQVLHIILRPASQASTR